MWGLGKLPIPNRTVPVYFLQIPFFCHNLRLSSTALVHGARTLNKDPT